MRSAIGASTGERVGAVLARVGVPPASVVVLDGDRIVGDDHRLDADGSYEAQLIEGYDIAYIRDALAATVTDDGDAPYVKRRLELTRHGELRPHGQPMTLDELARYVEDTVAETCAEFDLVPPGSTVLLGLSGGVDSSALLLLLDSVRRRGARFEIVAATFEDADMAVSPTFARAQSLTRDLGVEHVIVPATRAQEVFGLVAPLTEILPALMDTAYAHLAMYVDHHTTRRLLEVEAESRGVDRIALGLHTTDLVAGLLNGFLTGYAAGNLPSRSVGEFVYVYPLAFVAKRELHLYHLQMRGRLASHSAPNAWERHPADRGFYYWLADRLQETWPGHEVLLFAGQESRARTLTRMSYTTCTNCGGAMLQQAFTAVRAGECDVCMALRDTGFLTEPSVA